MIILGEQPTTIRDKSTLKSANSTKLREKRIRRQIRLKKSRCKKIGVQRNGVSGQTRGGLYRRDLPVMSTNHLDNFPRMRSNSRLSVSGPSIPLSRLFPGNRTGAIQMITRYRHLERIIYKLNILSDYYSEDRSTVVMLFAINHKPGVLKRQESVSNCSKENVITLQYKCNQYLLHYERNGLQ
ncbi:hypothetical protein J6590_027957 [Homalodisca vitripennis]|nr:hypothetical protein J6590_027957 [Homalodisca vitripennis]